MAGLVICPVIISRQRELFSVMAALVTAIHVFLTEIAKDVDARH